MRIDRFHCLLCGADCDATEIVYALPRAGFWARLWDALTSHGTARCPHCYSTMLRKVNPVAAIVSAPPSPPIFDEIDDDEWWKAIK